MKKLILIAMLLGLGLLSCTHSPSRRPVFTGFTADVNEQEIREECKKSDNYEQCMKSKGIPTR